MLPWFWTIATHGIIISPALVGDQGWPGLADRIEIIAKADITLTILIF